MTIISTLLPRKWTLTPSIRWRGRRSCWGWRRRRRWGCLGRCAYSSQCSTHCCSWTRGGRPRRRRRDSRRPTSGWCCSRRSTGRWSLSSRIQYLGKEQNLILHFWIWDYISTRELFISTKFYRHYIRKICQATVFWFCVFIPTPTHWLPPKN